MKGKPKQNAHSPSPNYCFFGSAGNLTLKKAAVGCWLGTPLVRKDPLRNICLPGTPFIELPCRWAWLPGPSMNNLPSCKGIQVCVFLTVLQLPILAGRPKKHQFLTLTHSRKKRGGKKKRDSSWLGKPAVTAVRFLEATHFGLGLQGDFNPPQNQSKDSTSLGNQTANDWVQPPLGPPVERLERESLSFCSLVYQGNPPQKRVKGHY